MSLACHSVHSKTVVESLNRHRANLTERAGLAEPAPETEDDTVDYKANLRAAASAARNAGAA